MITVMAKIAAVLTVAVWIGAMPITAGDLHLEAQATALSTHDSACGVVPSNEHAKRFSSLRDVLAAGAQPFELAPPTGHVFSFPRVVHVGTVYVGYDALGIRAPPQAS